jgi:tripartite-type tricarboxylate transporter receptor subunit TctC
MDAFKARLAEQSFEPKGCTAAEFAQLIKSDLEQWAATVKAFGFKPMD